MPSCSSCEPWGFRVEGLGFRVKVWGLGAALGVLSLMGLSSSELRG